MKVAVVIPCYKVKDQILSVLKAIPGAVDSIVVVDDACPLGSGQWVESQNKDPRVKVVYQQVNLGVGGATLAGFLAAKEKGAAIVVKLDGDGQMDPSLIPSLIKPILEGKADFTKGNRFHSPRMLEEMPWIRMLGNAGLSFLAKLTTGYWNVMDPTNGFLAMHTCLLEMIDAEKVSKRYFFENDLLFRLSLARAVVVDVPMRAKYQDEKSNLSVSHSLVTFPGKFFLRFWKRIFYRYFLRDFNIASLLMVKGLVFLVGGGVFGISHWIESVNTGVVASSGTVMLAALPILVGAQMLTFALLYDILMVPKDPLHLYWSEEKS